MRLPLCAPFLFGLAALAFAVGARAQSNIADQAMAACLGRNPGATVATVIAGCEAAIAADAEPNQAATAHFRLGAMHLRLRDYDRAVDDLTQALAIVPGDPLVLNRRCWARVLAGRDLKGALQDCDEVVRRQPNSAVAYDTRGFVLLRQARYADAILDYDRSLQINSRPNGLQASSLYGRGVAETRKGDVSDGETDIQLAQSIAPKIAETFASYGVKP